MTVPNITLNNDVQMPQLGFGVWQIPDDEAERAVAMAFEAGYRSIDTAKVYENEEGVGRALRSAGIPRDELFIATKLWNSDQPYEAALRAFDNSMRRLDLEQLDLYLMHWPMPGHDRYVEAWKAMEELYLDGRIRAIGVSNFTIEALQRLFDDADVVPAVNQIELHPTFAQGEVRAFHAEHGIATEAWSPLGQGTGVLDLPELAKVGGKYGKSPAQVVLRWHLQIGNVVIPKSVTPSRIAENIGVFDFELDDEDMAVMDALDSGNRTGPDPATYNWLG